MQKKYFDTHKKQLLLEYAELEQREQVRSTLLSISSGTLPSRLDSNCRYNKICSAYADCSVSVFLFKVSVCVCVCVCVCVSVCVCVCLCVCVCVSIISNDSTGFTMRCPGLVFLFQELPSKVSSFLGESSRREYQLACSCSILVSIFC